MLVDKSLVVYKEGESRYRLLEIVRQYAAERLTELGEESARDKHLSWCVALAEEAEPQLMGPEQGAWRNHLETEHDNLRTSLSWEEQRADGGEEGLRLAGALWRFWYVRGYLSEGRRRLDRALWRAAASEGEAAMAQAKALNGAGALARQQGDFARARALHEESLIIRRWLGDQVGAAYALGNLGMVAHRQNQPEWAARLRGAGAFLSESSGSPLDQEESDKTLASAVEALGEAAFAAAWNAGRAMTLDAAVAYALERSTE